MICPCLPLPPTLIALFVFVALLGSRNAAAL